MLIAFRSFSSYSLLLISIFTYFRISCEPTVDALRAEHIKMLEHENVEVAYAGYQMCSFSALEENEGVSRDND